MINNIVCTTCDNSWDQQGPYDTRCSQCGEDCDDQSYRHFLEKDDEEED